jgi:hypothetical protein
MSREGLFYLATQNHAGVLGASSLQIKIKLILFAPLGKGIENQGFIIFGQGCDSGATTKTLLIIPDMAAEESLFVRNGAISNLFTIGQWQTAIVIS